MKFYGIQEEDGYITRKEEVEATGYMDAHEKLIEKFEGEKFQLFREDESIPFKEKLRRRKADEATEPETETEEGG